MALVSCLKFCHHAAMSTRYRIMWGLVCVVMGIGTPAWAEDGSAGVSEDAYAALMGTEVLDIEDLAEGAEVQREYFNRITPSGFSWLQPMFPSVAPFDAKYFDEAFLDSLLGEETNSVAVYPLSLVLDPKTRETLIYNAEGVLITSVPSDGISRAWPADADPSRVTLTLDLIPADDAEQYLYAEDRIAVTLASNASKSTKTFGAGGFAMMSLETNHFGISDIQNLTNGNIRLTVASGTGDVDVAEIYAYTVVHTSSLVVADWTNEFGSNCPNNILWGPVSPPFNGLESMWTNRATNVSFTNGIGVWEDANISSNDRVRFYGAAKRADADHDGLTDGAELFVYHTSPTNRDTDADGWSDAEELVEETDPLDRFSATRLARGVVIHALSYNPSNGAAASNQWIQLHSSSASPVDLGDFRLQVAGSNYATKMSFSSNTWIQPGQFILVGGSNVEERDYSADLDLPNSYPTNPTAGTRLVGPEGMETNPADVVMYGTHTPFNEGGLPTNGWASTNTDLWAGRSNQLVRIRIGQDNDLRSDWTYRLVGELWNSESVLDTDGDGLTDGEELSGSAADGVPSDPLDPDTDDDGLEDGFEADHGLNPADTDSDGDTTLDPDEINPDTGNTYLHDQLGTDVTVSIDSSLPGWILGQSIGSNGWVKFTIEEWDGMGVWATIKEGGLEPENFTNSVANAVVAYSNNIFNGGFRTLQLLLISTNHAVPIEITVNDGGTYWAGQDPITLGPDIFAHFDAFSIDFIEMWETENRANMIFNSTPKDDPVDDDQDPDANGETYGVPRNYLYLVPDPADGAYKVTMKADIQPAELRPLVYAAGYVGSQIVSGSGRVPFDLDGECDLNFLHPGSSPGVEDYIIKVGFDQNGNSELDSGDLSMPCSVKNTTTDEIIGDPMVRGSSEDRYADAKSVIDNRVSVWGTEAPVLEHARALLRIFRDGNAAGVPIDKQPSSSTNQNFNAFVGDFAEWLTHCSGTSFDDGGSAALAEFYWNENTSLADLVASAPQIEDEATAFYDQSIYQIVTNYFANMPIGTTNVFPSSVGWYDIAHASESPAWVAPGTPTIELNSWLWDKVDDVNGAIGRGRLLFHKVRYTVEKRETLFGSELIVAEVRAWGGVSDLYDFNHDVDGTAQDAAILQIGYGNGSYGSSRNRGKIFRDRIEFNKIYTELP